MIEKLKQTVRGFYDKPAMPTAIEFFNKINELCDVVNEQQKQIDKVSCAILDLATPNGENKALKSLKAESKTPTDPYAEQRKWIGYLCWFWDDKYDLKTAGVLEEITTIEEEFHYAKKDTCTVWKHCEPVKPDDDIIYKGGDNE